MNWLIFFLYLALFCWLITIIPFFKKSGLSKKVICFLFVIKIIAGVAYFQFYSLPANKPNSDTWKFYNKSIPETDLLLHNPAQFAKDLFTTKYSSAGNLFDDKQSYWNDVKDEIMVKIMAGFNVFTFTNYYANIIWFNFLFFFGIIGFYRLMNEIYPNGEKIILIAAICFIPSFLFWCSGIHKDGLIFSSIGIILFLYQRIFATKKFFLNSLFILLLLTFVFFLRSYLAILLVPCLALGYLLHLFPRKKGIIILGAVMFGGLFVFTSKFINPSFNIPAFVVQKQMQFKRLKGGSQLTTPDLQPTFSSFAAALPVAIDVGFFRPHINEKGLNAKIGSLEIILFWLIFITCLIRAKRLLAQPPVVWVCLLFGILVLLIVGYTVNFSGAVIRYRSLVLPLLLAPLVCVASNNIIKKYI